MLNETPGCGCETPKPTTPGGDDRLAAATPKIPEPEAAAAAGITVGGLATVNPAGVTMSPNPPEGDAADSKADGAAEPKTGVEAGAAGAVAPKPKVLAGWGLGAAGLPKPNPEDAAGEDACGCCCGGGG